MASDEEVAGIVVGIVAAGLLLLAVVVWLVRRHLRNFERHTLPAMADKLAAEPAQPAKPPASFRERWLRVESMLQERKEKKERREKKRKEGRKEGRK